MSIAVVNLSEKLGLFTEHWQPHLLARLNDYHVKVAKLLGDFVWHSHPETDELFLVVEGKLRIDFRDGSIQLNAGDLCVVPKGMEHKPYAQKECAIMLIEPAGTLNTGDAGGERTVEKPDWI
jgi:mannose-6-phosphate isomerase-like protein (cupin superfamily)